MEAIISTFSTIGALVLILAALWVIGALIKSGLKKHTVLTIVCMLCAAIPIGVLFSSIMKKHESKPVIRSVIPDLEAHVYSSPELPAPLVSVAPGRVIDAVKELPSLISVGRMMDQHSVIAFKDPKISIIPGMEFNLIYFSYTDIGRKGLSEEDQFAYGFALPGPEEIHIIERDILAGSTFTVYKYDDVSYPPNAGMVEVKLENKRLFAQTLRTVALNILEQELAAKKK